MKNLTVGILAAVLVTTTFADDDNKKNNSVAAAPISVSTSVAPVTSVTGSNTNNLSSTNTNNLGVSNDNNNSNRLSNNIAVSNRGGDSNNSNSNSLNSVSRGGEATATGGNAKVSGNTVQSNSEINVSNNTTSIQQKPAVASAIAPNTIFSGGMDSCMGSTTGSVQGLSFGVAVGSTWTDGHCVALRAAVRLNELGFKNTAAARLCAIPEIAEAFRKSKEFDCGE